MQTGQVRESFFFQFQKYHVRFLSTLSPVMAGTAGAKYQGEINASMGPTASERRLMSCAPLAEAVAKFLAPGTLAPNFEAKDQAGRTVRMSDLRGRTVVLYFYPRDETLGCTMEACAFRDQFTQFESLGATEIAYQPAGPDIARELEAFATAARG